METFHSDKPSGFIERQRMIQKVVFMLERDVELFIEHCELKGLSKKTIGSYEQTIVQTEKVTYMMVQNYISAN